MAGEKARQRRELVRLAWRRLRGGELTPRRAALSVGVGLLIGITPAFGFHWLLVIGVCIPLRLDTGVAYLAANISLPFIAPFLTFGEIETGALLLHGQFVALAPSQVKNLELRTLAAELAVGSAILAPLGGALGAAITYVLVRLRWQRTRRTPQLPDQPSS
ncbi:MAG: hypothetical protein JWP97_4946 [Labilithrix sp.]|nr:hypothetical protein [Labilithrix sp.]